MKQYTKNVLKLFGCALLCAILGITITIVLGFWGLTL